MTESILAVYGPSNVGKIERHVTPLADTVEVTLVCINGAEPFERVEYRTVPSWGIRPVGLAFMLAAALFEVYRNEYAGVVSFSLFPHGCIALLVGRLAGVPVHLGILGIDLEVHARASYGGIVRHLLRQFDAISVPGSRHRQQVEALGVPAERVTILANAIDVERFAPADDIDERYDLIWVGRFGAEKDPLLFVRTLATLARREVSFTAVMVGDGPLKDDVDRQLRDEGLDDRVYRPGWVDEPAEFYRQSRVFVLTSRRDALPLTLVEAMATGVVPVVPDVGNVSDVATDGTNAVVLDEWDADSLADAVVPLLESEERRERLATNALAVRDRYSLDAAAADWRTVLRIMGIRSRSPTREAFEGSTVRAT